MTILSVWVWGSYWWYYANAFFKNVFFALGSHMLFSDLDFDQCLILSICLLWTDPTNGLKIAKVGSFVLFRKKKDTAKQLWVC